MQCNRGFCLGPLNYLFMLSRVMSCDQWTQEMSLNDDMRRFLPCNSL